MLTSGPKSYYEEYTRKKDSERALTKPPALLTDRNAYINFLEVQLERVSAACFAVQSYENRFNDMQGLIVSLDERCNNTTRLISLAEQCTEEVRSEAYQRADSEAQTMRAFRSDTKKTLEAMNSKVASLERALSSFPQIDGRLNAMDKRVNEMEASQISAVLDNRVANQALDERIKRLDSVKDELFSLVESTRASLSRVTFDVEENSTRVNNYMAGIENRVNETMHANKEDLQREIAALQARCTNQNDELKKTIELRDLEMLNATKKQYKALGEELDASRRKWSLELDGLTAHLKEDSQRRVDKVQHSIDQVTSQLRSSQTEQAGFMCDLEESFLNQLEGVHSSLCKVSQHQQAVEEKVATTQKSLEGRLQDLQTSITASPMRNSAQGWNNANPPARSFMVQSVDMAGGAGGDGRESVNTGPIPQPYFCPPNPSQTFPMSPVPNPPDASFVHEYAHDLHNMSGLTGAPSGFFCPQPVHPGTQSHMFMHASSLHQQLLEESAAESRLRAKSPTVVAGRDLLRVPVRSTSPSLVSRRSTAGAPQQTDLSWSKAQARARSSSLSPKAARKKSNAQDGAEVIRQFIELYQADRQEIAQRLEALGAPMSETATRLQRRSGLRKVKDKNKVSRRETTAELQRETTADQLGSFLVNYRRDRAEIMNRLSSVRASEAAAVDGETAGVGNTANVRDDHQASVAPHAPTEAPTHCVPLSPSEEPAEEAQNTSLSRSMDEFVRTYRNRGKEKSGTEEKGTHRAGDDRNSAASVSSASSGSSDGSYAGSGSPQRSRSDHLLAGVREGQPQLKRYMQMTESQSIARSLSPQQSPRAAGLADRSALEWEYDHVALKPLWKKTNTYQSPGRTSRDSSTGRTSSTSPGARTASSLIDRLAKLDRTAASQPAARSSAQGYGRSSSTAERASAAQVSFAAAPPSAADSDAASVISTSTTSSTTSGQKK